MAESPPDDRYYHGASPLSVVSILVDGFRLLDVPLRNYGAGYFGHGLYITRRLGIAGHYAADWCASSERPSYVLVVRPAPATHWLLLDGGCDQRVIDSLRREFSDEILRPDFDRALPRNKRLTGEEVRNLFNHLWGTQVLRGFSDDHRQARRYLQRIGFHGLGDPDNYLGIVVFNPSRLTPVDVLELHRPNQHQRPLDRARLVADAAEELQSSWTWLRDLRATVIWAPKAGEFSRTDYNRRVEECQRRGRCLSRCAERWGLPEPWQCDLPARLSRFD